MRIIFAAAGVALLLGATSVSALTYATSVYSERLDTTVVTAAKNGNRNDPANALGPRDATMSPLQGFFSLGLGKYADFKFGTAFSSTGTVYEVTSGNSTTYPEFVDIFVYNSPDGALTEVARALRNDSAQSGATFTFTGTWDTLRILDVTRRECGAQSLTCLNSLATNGDGFDMDAVGVQAIPLPAAAWLLLGAAGGLFAAKRRQSLKAA